MIGLKLNVIEQVKKVIQILRQVTKNMDEPASTAIVAEFGRDPFLILASAILSPRTKDTVSLPASRRLFAIAKNPQEMLQLSVKEIKKTIYPVGFYRQKAKYLHEASKQVIERFGGKVPKNQKGLMSLSGVGQKVANLILGEAFSIPAICVDTHVQTISNRLGLVHTKTPQATEEALQNILPKKDWIEFNTLLVKWGQNICTPVSPFCSKCAISHLCPRVGVTTHR